MNDISMVFYGLHLVCKDKSVPLEEISDAYDYINRYVLPHNELYDCISRLIEINLIQQEGDNYFISDNGKMVLEEALVGTKSHLDVCSRIDGILEKTQHNNR